MNHLAAVALLVAAFCPPLGTPEAEVPLGCRGPSPVAVDLCLRLAADPDNPSLQLAYGSATGDLHDAG